MNFLYIHFLLPEYHFTHQTDREFCYLGNCNTTTLSRPIRINGILNKKLIKSVSWVAGLVFRSIYSTKPLFVQHNCFKEYIFSQEQDLKMCLVALQSPRCLVGVWMSQCRVLGTKRMGCVHQRVPWNNLWLHIVHQITGLCFRAVLVSL